MLNEDYWSSHPIVPGSRTSCCRKSICSGQRKSPPEKGVSPLIYEATQDRGLEERHNPPLLALRVTLHPSLDKGLRVIDDGWSTFL